MRGTSPPSIPSSTRRSLRTWERPRASRCVLRHRIDAVPWQSGVVRLHDLRHAAGVQSENFAHDSFATALARVAGGQHGLLRTHELHLAGLDNAAITRWVRAAKLHRKSRGVYTLGHDALSREGEFLSAVFAGGERALLAQ